MCKVSLIEHANNFVLFQFYCISSMFIVHGFIFHSACETTLMDMGTIESDNNTQQNAIKHEPFLCVILGMNYYIYPWLISRLQ